jgi:hypothetical protein
VRVPSPKLLRLGSCSRGSIAEPGDGELSVPGILQPTIELSSPIDKVLSPIVGTAGNPQQDSFFMSQTTQATGAAGATNTTMCFLDRGAWSIDFAWIAAFIGTTNIAKNAIVNLVDSDSVALPLFSLPFLTGQFVALAHTYRFVFQRDGWAITIAASATVAGDSLQNHLSLNCRKSL